jgi:tetratricopeptide (TPR) repeat protein
MAKKRGPYGFGDYALLAHPEIHPLARPPEKLLRKLRRLWKKSEKFCLAHFRSDDSRFSAGEDLLPVIDRGVTVVHGTDLLVFLADERGKSALQWAEKVIKRYLEKFENRTVSAGISCFPYKDFKKSETAHNCTKALAHAAFFGDGSAVLFDAVSLNISGDIFFRDGDLVQAVREYKRGLLCDSGNINLFNSLGVTYALMNRYKPAKECFENGLKLDADNFMALYNLGLGELDQGRKKEAIVFFRKALNCRADEELDTSVMDDLHRQIGILASETGEYQAGLDYLLPLYKSLSGGAGAERLIFHIGSCYCGLGDGFRAMEWLQRALRANEYDHRAMNLLGKVYFDNGQGAEVALALCRKSVELCPDLPRYRIILARIQLHCGMFTEARDTLKFCLNDRQLKVEARLLAARCCFEIGHVKRAVAWFNKVAKEDGKRYEEYAILSHNLSGLL